MLGTEFNSDVYNYAALMFDHSYRGPVTYLPYRCLQAEERTAGYDNLIMCYSGCPISVLYLLIYFKDVVAAHS
jgi:hypothetical protein